LSGLAVTNSTCLIALERIGRLDLLPRLFTRISIPQSVRDEFGLPLPYLNVTVPTNRVAAAALRTQLDDGEAEAIVLATIEPALNALRNASFFMTDQLNDESLRIAGEAPST